MFNNANFFLDQMTERYYWTYCLPIRTQINEPGDFGATEIVTHQHNRILYTWIIEPAIFRSLMVKNNSGIILRVLFAKNIMSLR